MAKKRIVKRHAVKRVKGEMYYVDGAGNLCAAKMKHAKKRKKR